MTGDSARTRAVALMILLWVWLSAGGEAQQTQYAHLTYSQGSVSVQSGAQGDWSPISPNTAFTPSDNLWVDRASRVELYWQSTAFRLDAETSITLHDLAENHGGLTLWLGSLMVHIPQLETTRFSIETPNSKITLNEPGDYRITVNSPGNETLVTVWLGNAEAKGASEECEIDANETVRLIGTGQLEVQSALASAPDDFERWAFSRDQSASAVVSNEPNQIDTNPDRKPDDPNNDSDRSGGNVNTNAPAISAPLPCPTPWCEWDAYPDIWAMVLGDSVVTPNGQPSPRFPSQLSQGSSLTMPLDRAVRRPSQLQKQNLALANLAMPATSNPGSPESSGRAHTTAESNSTQSAKSSGRSRSERDQKKSEQFRSASQQSAARSLKR